VSVKSGDIDRIFNKLRMKIREGKDTLAWFEYDGRPIIYTRRSHGRGDIGNIAHFIRQQLKVSEEQFAGLRDCPLSLADYVAILRGKGLIPPE
jgi:hypothetical protein